MLDRLVRLWERFVAALRRKFTKKARGGWGESGLLLLNRERVILETVKLAQFKIAGILKIPLTAVQPSMVKSGKSIKPRFDVNIDAAQGVTRAEVHEVVSRVYGFTKRELNERLAGLSQYRK